MTQKIAHYRIEEELGRGGMGIVYRCFDEKLRRQVAIKVLNDAYLSDGKGRTRILAEARAASALNHPAITTIYEVSEASDQHFIVMELVQGPTLRSLLQSGALEMPRILRLAVQLADGLAVAHTQHVIHGDLKPENIIALPDGRVKLLDFGVARHSYAPLSATARFSDATTEELSSSTGGTIAYMSPEQLRSGELDARSDLFSFGVVLFELCAGARPFTGQSPAEVIADVLRKDPPPLESVVPSVSPELCRIVRKLLEKDPQFRYQSASELRVDLTNVERHRELADVLPASTIDKPTIAVLPFQLLTPDPADEYLRLALAETAIHALASTGKKLVRPISAVMRYTAVSADPLMVGRELNVQNLVQGTIQKFGTRLRVQLQLWDLPAGNVTASVKFDTEVANLFLLQDDIGRWLTAADDEEPSPKQVVAPPTSNVTAYELYLRAGERLFKLNLWDTRTAVDMLESAVKLDPRFVDAWGRLAGACVRMATVFEPNARWLALADRAIKRAIALDPGNADAFCAKGELLWTPAKRFQNKPALRALVRALKLNPGQHRAQIWRGLILFHLGLHEESEQGLLTALAAQPDDAFTFVFLSQVNMYRNRYSATESYLQRALALDPTHIWANVFFPTMYIYAGQMENAAERIRTARKFLPQDPWLTSCEALMMAKRNDTKGARKLLQQSYKTGKPLLHTHHMWHTQAAVHCWLGEPAPAVALLKKASSLGLPNYPLFRDDPHFEPLRSYKPYLTHMRFLKKEWDAYAREFGSTAKESATKTPPAAR